jgi:hypothetical protein
MKIRFSIRHLLVAVALFAALFSWLTYNWNIVQQRKQLRRDIGPWAFQNSPPHSEYYDAVEGQIPLVRRMLGDRSFGHLYLPKSISDDIVDRVELLVGHTIFWEQARRTPTAKELDQIRKERAIKKPSSPIKKDLTV